MSAIDEGTALLEALLALPHTRVATFAASIRNRLAQQIFETLQPSAPSPFTTVERDFARLVELVQAAEPGAPAAVATWIEHARTTLGALQATHVDARRRAMAAPGRDPTIAKFVPEKTKFGALDDLVKIGWLEHGHAAAAAVAYIEVTRHKDGMDGPTEGGTCFLIDREHVMTAFHVVEQRDRTREDVASDGELETQVANARIAFDYTAKLATATFIQGATLVAHDADLDFAVLKLPAPVSAQPLRFFLGTLRDPDDGFTFVANIIQHPEKQSKQLGLRNNAVWKLDHQHIYYFTDTRGGTSGAPVFDDHWNVIAMHTGWEPFTVQEAIYMGRNLGFANRGTLAATLVATLRAKSNLQLITVGG